MRILIVNHYSVGPRSAGGIRHWLLASELASIGVSAIILRSRVNHFAQGLKSNLPAVENVDGVRLYGLKGPRYRRNGFSRMVNMALFGLMLPTRSSLFRQADVVVGSSPSPFAAAAAMFIARVFRKPFVLEIRDFWPKTLVDLGAVSESGLVSRLLYKLERIMVEGADGVIVVPPSGEAYFKEQRLQPKALLTLPNFSRRIEVEGPAIWNRDGAAAKWIDDVQAAGGTLFCYTGSLGLANDLGSLLEAFRALSSSRARIIIVGDGPDRENLVERFGDDPRIFFTGQVGKGDALRILQRADFSVFHLQDAPVFRYGLSPNKLIDYLFAGKPILYAGPGVASPASGTEAAVSALPGNVDSIYAAFCACLEMDEVEYRRRSCAAASRAVDVFSSEGAAKRFLDFVLLHVLR